MVIVYDMSSGEFEYRDAPAHGQAHDAYREEPVYGAGQQTMLGLEPVPYEHQEQLRRERMPASLANVDVERFLSEMEE